MEINTRRYENQIMRKKGVIGIGQGNKITKGVDTGKPAIIVFVEKKLPKDKIPFSELIPQKLGSYLTDVIEAGEVKAGIFVSSSNSERKNELRPAKPGVSISTSESSAGTLGCIIYKNNWPYILTSNHVVGEAFEGEDIRGSIVLQPGKADGGTGYNAIAQVTDFIPIHKNNCYVDCAIAKVVNPASVSNDILGIGFIKGVRDVKIGEEVKKSGRTSGFTIGKVIAKNTSIKVNYRHCKVLCRDQIITTGMSKEGDSGSLGITGDNFAFGLLFAGSNQVSIFNPINRVKSYLGFDFYPPNSLAKQFIDFIEELGDKYWNAKESSDYYELLYKLTEADNYIAPNQSQDANIERKRASAVNIIQKIKMLFKGA